MTTTIPKGIMRDSLLLGDFCVFFFSEFLSAFVCLFLCVRLIRSLMSTQDKSGGRRVVVFFSLFFLFAYKICVK